MVSLILCIQHLCSFLSFLGSIQDDAVVEKSYFLIASAENFLQSKIDLGTLARDLGMLGNRRAKHLYNSKHDLHLLTGDIVSWIKNNRMYLRPAKPMFAQKTLSNWLVTRQIHASEWDLFSGTAKLGSQKWDTREEE